MQFPESTYCDSKMISAPSPARKPVCFSSSFMIIPESLAVSMFITLDLPSRSIRIHMPFSLGRLCMTVQSRSRKRQHPWIAQSICDGYEHGQAGFLNNLCAGETEPASGKGRNNHCGKGKCGLWKKTSEEIHIFHKLLWISQIYVKHLNLHNFFHIMLISRWINDHEPASDSKKPFVFLMFLTVHRGITTSCMT